MRQLQPSVADDLGRSRGGPRHGCGVGVLGGAFPASLSGLQGTGVSSPDPGQGRLVARCIRTGPIQSIIGFDDIPITPFSCRRVGILLVVLSSLATAGNCKPRDPFLILSLFKKS